MLSPLFHSRLDRRGGGPGCTGANPADDTSAARQIAFVQIDGDPRYTPIRASDRIIS